MKLTYRGYLGIATFLILFHIVISQFFTRICIFNRGIAFGFLSWADQFSLLVVGIIAIGAVVFVWKAFLRDDRKEIEHGIIILTVMSGLSNFFDRLTHGAICDYIALPFSFPVINLNDIILSANLILLLFIIIKHGNNNR